MIVSPIYLLPENTRMGVTGILLLAYRGALALRKTNNVTGRPRRAASANNQSGKPLGCGELPPLAGRVEIGVTATGVTVGGAGGVSVGGAGGVTVGGAGGVSVGG
ncbi:hypothetical protein A3D00_02960 [Candidatus Woesebacteria bacterium RIFCSPHIGHO2_02_FULL_38_9]|uniref:Uncharacterized protein n=1 Tax=Candidatus Woesebacteria bacterium RIFCSPHIGHO2_01_FULL_39_28 TaxID=1802496 RepID=A0A1F7YH19_9BACT|nr:MAG: hypothetical protein A2627_03915 [Candidatus Woesebacteria bacterium RIFCSPHIGHO2_01_FULL_39_28]OGM35343.1 MAG: hypothetical protein A3D00_02960 [Candidatus Woesebacteria bacterium RIFCSPHIGHO2_02_FULL_38_9]